MSLFITGLTIVLPILYALVAINYGVHFVRRSTFAERTSTPAMASVWGLHVLYLLLRAIESQHFVISSQSDVLSFVALSLGGLYLYLERVQRSKSTGVFVVSLTALTQAAASLLSPTATEVGHSQVSTALFGLHTVSIVVGYSAFALSAVYGVMFVLLYKVLKTNHFGILFDRLPSLDTLGRTSFSATLVGWLFLTITIALGLSMSNVTGQGVFSDPHVVTIFFVWFIYGAAVAAYMIGGVRGAGIIGLTLAGFAVAVLGMLGKVLFWTSQHPFVS